MLTKTKHFGEIDLDESKIIFFENGILGFEEYKKYTIIYDNGEEETTDVAWLQSLEEPSLAIPVMNPFFVKDDFNPEVNDELLKTLGDMSPEDIVVLVSITVPTDITKLSVNLKAPFIINAGTKKGAQVIVENQSYEVKYHFYDKLKAIKEAKEGK